MLFIYYKLIGLTKKVLKMYKHHLPFQEAFESKQTSLSVKWKSWDVLYK